MAVEKIIEKLLPEFDIPERYKADKWEIKEWDYYKNETEERKKRWDARSGLYNGSFDFTLCQNQYIREELKYAVSTIIERGTHVSSLGDCFDRFKIVCEFLNDDKRFDSLLGYKDDIASFERYFVLKKHNKATIIDGKRITKDMTTQQVSRKNRTITFFQYCITVVSAHYDKNLTLMERDVWTPKYLSSLGYDTKNGRRLDFSDIPQPDIKRLAKEFCKFKIGAIGYDSIYSYLHSIRIFAIWLSGYDSSIQYLNKINRTIIEEFFLYLRVESDYSDNKANTMILYLKKFFETLVLLELDNIPDKTLILAQDYAFKSKKESKYFTDEESQNITNSIQYMNKTDGKMVFCLKTLGLRINELFSLKPTSIRQNEDGSSYLVIDQTKVDREYTKPLTTQVLAVLKSEIDKNKKKLGHEPDFIFLGKNGKKMEYTAFCRRVNKVFYEHKVLDRTGNLLRFQTHRFRATFATNLINAGYGAEETAKMLGHNNLDSLTHYIHLHDETVLKQLAPRIARDNALISNIYSMQKLPEIPDITTGSPLCNGWCARDINSLGVCKKANSCLTCGLFKPSPEFLNNYCVQLEDVLATIEVAKSNNMEALLQKTLKDKECLEQIIASVKEMLQ